MRQIGGVAGWRPSQLSTRARGGLALLVVCLALLTAGGASAHLSAPAASVTRMSTAITPAPTSSPTPPPAPPPPQFIPRGWQVYRAYHFALAFPAGWLRFEHVVPNASGGVEAASVSFESPDGAESIGISEHESLDSATLKQFCAQLGSPTTYSGLPMITSRIAGTLRMFVFVSTGAGDSTGSATGAIGATGGVVYTLLYSEENTPQEVKWLYDSIFATFRPEYSTPACH